MPTDYDGPIHRDYARGRALAPEVYAAWAAAFAQHLPSRRPLDGLDLGSGTGRWAPYLAEQFGPVVGVEPSAAMRGVAEREATYPAARYLAGSAEKIPLEDASVDYCLLFLVWHHVADPARGAAEIARVLRPGGVVLCRTQLSDHMPDLPWLRCFPGAAGRDAAMYRTLDEELALFATAGLEADPGLTWVDEPSLGTARDRLERLRTRSYSLLRQMPDADFEAGIAALEAQVATYPDRELPGEEAALLVLRRTA